MKKKTLLRIAILVLTIVMVLPCAFYAAEMLTDLATVAAPATNVSLVFDGNYIKNVPDNLTVADFLESFNKEGAYVTTQGGYRLGEASRIATGNVVVFDSKEYTIIVNGDVNGDSYVSSKDIIRAKKLMKSGEYSIYEYALDLNSDGIIDGKDISELSSYVSTNESEPGLSDMAYENLGDDFYATIDLSYTDNALTALAEEGNVVASDKNNSPNQAWHFTRNSDGSYNIKNVGMGGLIHTAYSNSDFGTNVGYYLQNGDACQQWYLVEKNGGYVFSAKFAEERVLDIADGSTENGANLQLYGVNYSPAQIFHINKIDDVDMNDLDTYITRFSPLDYSKTFYANLKFGSRNISVSDNDNVCLSEYSQYWKFEMQADKSYKITSMYNGKALDVFEAKMTDGTNIQSYASNDTSAQRWFIYMKNGGAMLCSAANKKFVVDVYAASDSEGNNIHLYTANNSAAQFFQLCDYTTNLPAYSVTCPYNRVVYGRYHTLEEAKANVQTYLGQVVHDLSGNLVYHPYNSRIAAKILYNAKLVSDFAAANNFSYGHADHNPGYNWQYLDINRHVASPERISSCDRLVDWVLWRCGITDTRGNKISHGPVVYEQVNWIPSLGYKKITNVSQLQPGDIVFTSYDYTKPGTPGHIFICASNNLGGNVYLRYDHGSVERIRYSPTDKYGNPYTYLLGGKAPFKEVIGTSAAPFYYAYRPID